MQSAMGHVDAPRCHSAGEAAARSASTGGSGILVDPRGWRPQRSGGGVDALPGDDDRAGVGSGWSGTQREPPTRDMERSEQSRRRGERWRAPAAACAIAALAAWWLWPRDPVLPAPRDASAASDAD